MSEIVVTGRKDEPQSDTHGNLSYFVSVSVDGQALDKGILVKHKGDKPIMQVGDTFEQHGFDGYETKKSQGGNEYFKAKRPQQQQGGGGFGGGGNNRPRDPAERESIERQVAAKCASDLLVGFMATGWKPDTALKLGELHTVLAKSIALEIKG